jgi:hypothetical protein
MPVFSFSVFFTINKKNCIMKQSQNSVSFGIGFGKSGQSPLFLYKFRVIFPKTEVLGRPLMIISTLITGPVSKSGQRKTGSTVDKS